MSDYSWPTGVTTTTCTVSVPRAALGGQAALEVQVVPVLGGAHRLIWTATGETFARLSQTLTGLESAEFTLPHVDQAGWSDGDGNAVTLWAYNVLVTARYGGQATAWRHVVQPLVGTATIDLDSLPDGQPLAPVVVGSGGPPGPTGPAGPTGPTGATGAGVPTGGTTGQVLKKNSGTNYDTIWAAESGGISSLTYANALAGSRFDVIHNGTNWIDPTTGSTLAARPSSRTNIHFDLYAPTAIADPSWMIDYDLRTQW